MELDRDTLFKRLRGKAENKSCFDCPSRNPTWATVPYGCYLCLQCAGVHRSLGVHISFVRSTTLDDWTPEQLKLMAVGGNGRARQFFKQHGWDELGADKIEAKYTSRAAQLYRAMLDKEAAKLTESAAMTRATSGHPEAAHVHEFEPLPEPASKAEPPSSEAATATAEVKPAAVLMQRPTAAIATKGRLVSGKKPTGGKLGLGVKKLETKVDEALFDQAPAPEPVAPVAKAAAEPAPGAAAAGAVAASATAPAGSRFSYDVLNTEPANMQRGKDGHLTLGGKGGDFFSGGDMSGARRATAGSVPAAKPAAAAAAPTVAQQKFGNAKAISSRAFQEGQESESDRQTKLSKFQGAAAISSADYFNQGDNGGGGASGARGPRRDEDLSAGDIVSQLSAMAQQDLQNVTKKLSGMASQIMNELSRGY